MPRATSLLLASLLLAGEPIRGPSSEASHPFVAGEPLPALVLPALADGTPRALRELGGGRPTVLHVFASW